MKTHCKIGRIYFKEAAIQKAFDREWNRAVSGLKVYPAEKGKWMKLAAINFGLTIITITKLKNIK